MYCMHCGKQIPDNAMYCSHCGMVVVKNRQQPPVYTPPVSQQPPAYTPPAPQQPAYEAPVNIPQNNGTYTPPVKPLEEIHGYVPPVQEPGPKPKNESPAPEAPVHAPAKTTASGEDAFRKTHQRKKQIMLAAIVAAVVVVVLILLGYIILSQPVNSWRGFLTPRAARSLQNWVLSIYRGMRSIFR